MSEHNPTVFIIDDDGVVRNTIAQLVETVDLNSKTFASAEEFIASYDPLQSGCLVLDVRMPGISGLKLQSRLKENNTHIPIIFISGHGDIQMAGSAFKNGAVDFIEKPFRNQVLLDQIQEAIARDAKLRQKQIIQKAARDKLESLTQREHEVWNLITAGNANKVIATKLELSQRTVEVHRASVMEKLQVDSVAELVTLVGGANDMQ